MATILILDDGALDRRFLASLLAHHGYRVLEAVSGEQALAVMRVDPADLIVTDMLMAHDGGYRFVRRLREHPDISGARVVFRVPAYLAASARVLAEACGVDHVVTDLSDTGHLLETIKSALASPADRGPMKLPKDADDRFYPLLSSLYQRISESDTANVRLEREAAECAMQLDIARSALEQEVTKRIWAEKELTQANLRLRAQAVRDPLTGLYNRRYLEESLDREESRAKRSGRPLGIIMIDIDHFKRWNDTFGHAAGDEVLRAVSRYMESVARAEDILCRYGGEEFVLMMTNTSPDTLMHRAEELRAGVQNVHILHEGRQLGPVTLSGGLAIFPEDGESVHAVLQVADTALYRAKKEGRNRIVVGSRALA